MNPEKLKQELAGKESGTAPESEAATDEGIELNNATVPTPEEEENAGITPTSDTPEPETVSETTTEVTTEEEQPAPVAPEATGGEIDPELGIAEASATAQKMFTQSQVDEIAGKARKEGREKALRDEYARYGVSSAEELDELFSDAQRFSTLQERYDADKKAWADADTSRNEELTNVKERVALLESGIDKDRYEDAKLILKGKGLEVTAENIAQELATHPEWKKMEQALEMQNPNLPFRKVNPMMQQPKAPRPETPATQISVLGNNGSDMQPEEISERQRAMDMFFRNKK